MPMGTWTANNSDRVGDIEYLGSCIAQTYSIAVVTTNTGGTLTVGNMRTILNVAATGWRVTGPTVLAITGNGLISGNQVTIAHNDPGEDATVLVKVWGKR